MRRQGNVPPNVLERVYRVMSRDEIKKTVNRGYDAWRVSWWVLLLTWLGCVAAAAIAWVL